MTNINYNFIEEYIRDNIIYTDEKLIEMRKYADEFHVPIVEPETEEFIKFLISVSKPKRILELGTAIGYSSISFAKFSKRIELIDTVEIREEMADIAKKNIQDENLEDIIKVHLLDAYDYLLDCDKKYDLIFIDAAKGQYEKYFNEALKNLDKNGIIICDNVLFKGMVANQELVKRRKKTIVKRLRTFLKDMKREEEFVTSIVPIGDGVLLVREKDEED
ncbi:O-methyltransferase [Peptoniphilus sp.]|jgi:predicted O-methyltransferase YrrM|uniref:O-methyltransferase n=1 Tax=Peptoniphilus sp. TaxID=1971214 RepID=UPI003D8C6F51